MFPLDWREACINEKLLLLIDEYLSDNSNNFKDGKYSPLCKYFINH